MNTIKTSIKTFAERHGFEYNEDNNSVRYGFKAFTGHCLITFFPDSNRIKTITFHAVVLPAYNKGLDVYYYSRAEFKHRNTASFMDRDWMRDLFVAMVSVVRDHNLTALEEIGEGFRPVHVFEPLRF